MVSEASDDPQRPESATGALRHYSFILTVWYEWSDPAPPPAGVAVTWRGFVETAARKRRYFGTLGELNQIIVAATGWRDPADPRTITSDDLS